MSIQIADLAEAIERKAEDTELPDGSSLRTLSTVSVEKIAARHGVLGSKVEIAALEKDIVPARYLRNLKTMTTADQVRLLNSRAAVVGLGGLGGTVTEILTRAGVGSLVLIDGDRFEDHNLNRQLLSSHKGLGESKAREAAQRVEAVNSAVSVEICDAPMTEVNGPELVKGCQVVVDCLDNIPSRFAVEAVARQAGIPLVSAAVAGVAGHITTIFPQDTGLELIYGKRQAVQNPKGVETTLGCLPQVVLLMASLEGAEAIKVLLGQTEQLLHNRLLLVDLTDNTFDTVELL